MGWCRLRLGFSEVKKYVKIHLLQHGTYIQKQTASDLYILVDEVCEGEVGERWEIEIVEMTEDEYAGLPEFEGH